MRNLLRDLSLAGKVVSGVGALGIIPGVTPLRVVLLLIVAIILKDLADGFYDRVEAFTARLRSPLAPVVTLEQQACPAGHTGPLPSIEAQKADLIRASASTPPDRNSNLIKCAPSLAVALCIAVGLLGSLTGCESSGVSTATGTSGAGSAAIVATPTATPSQADLLSFAEQAQNVVQDVNTGAAILAPDVTAAATLAQLVVHGSQETAILNKIVSVSSAVSSAGASAGLPAPVVQSQVSAGLTPQAAAAIVQQVTTPAATVPPSSSGALWHPQPLRGDCAFTASF